MSELLELELFRASRHAELFARRVGTGRLAVLVVSVLGKSLSVS